MFWRKKTPKVKAIEITDQNFVSTIKEAGDQPILIDFWAPWCGPCKVIGPIVDELANDFKDRAVVGKVNVDQNTNLSFEFQVKSIPTLMIFYKGQLTERFNGLIPKPNLAEILEEYIASEK